MIVFILTFVGLNLFNNSSNKIQPSNYSDDNLKILYLGNMGVLIESKNQTVLIDGFHKEYKPAYAYPSKEMLDSIIDGNYPGFTKIELNLVTHKHKDHFNPELTLHFLKENVHSLTIGPEQVKEELAKNENDTNQFLERVKVIDSDYNIHSIQHQGILIKSIRCNHTYQSKHNKIQNIAYLIDINGYKILHVGDTEWDLSKDVFEKLNLLESNIDVAILPFWMLLEETSTTKVTQLINPNIVIASHIDPNFGQQVVEEVQVNFPDVVSLTELNRTIKFKK